MHPLDRVRRAASYLLAGLLVLNAAFCLAMLALSVVRAASGDAAYGPREALTFAALAAVFAAAARFFVWWGRGAER